MKQVMTVLVVVLTLGLFSATASAACLEGQFNIAPGFTGITNNEGAASLSLGLEADVVLTPRFALYGEAGGFILYDTPVLTPRVLLGIRLAPPDNRLRLEGSLINLGMVYQYLPSMSRREQDNNFVGVHFSVLISPLKSDLVRFGPFTELLHDTQNNVWLCTIGIKVALPFHGSDEEGSAPTNHLFDKH